ncbi:hypothetical protein ACET3Z_032793 [Daucus carota]
MVSLQEPNCSDNTKHQRHYFAQARSMRTIRSSLCSSFSGDLDEPCSSISPENLELMVKNCVQNLDVSSVSVRRSAAERLRCLAKNRAENRALIGELGAVPALIGLLQCGDSCVQEHSVTALLNLSLLEENRRVISELGGVKALIHVLERGVTETSRQNAACALLNLALVDENRGLIGALGAIPPLVVMLQKGSTRGKKDAITTLYKICCVDENKERAVNCGIVKLLVEMIGEEGSGMAEKAMAVLCRLAGVESGKEKIVEEGGISVLVEVIEEGSMNGKEFAVMTLIQLCDLNMKNRGLVVREGCIPPLIELSLCGASKARQKAKILLRYLRESRQEASGSSP